MTKKTQSAVDEKFISQLVATLSSGDISNAEKTLEHFAQQSKATRTRSLFEISMSQDDTAYHLFNYLEKSRTIHQEDRDILIELLLDKARSQPKFILLFIENADSKHIKAAVPVLANILVTETDSHILYESIEALGSIKEKACINVIADFIFYDHEELKQAAVKALGNIGGASAIKRLAFANSTSKADSHIEQTLERLQNQLSLDQQMDDEQAEQFASQKDTLKGMADDSDIAQLLKMLNSSSPHDRHTAIDLLIETGIQAIPAISENINMKDSDSIINGLDILGNIRNEIALPHVLKILNSHHKDSNVRFAAYEAISKLPPVKSTVSLIEGLEDSSEQVRLAAATAININLSDVMVAGLKAKIETSGRSSKRKSITSAILDSHSGSIFSSLLSSDSFVFLATDYLISAHPATASYFIDILNKRGTRSLAEKIRDGLEEQTKQDSLAIFVVDDSEITLKFYIRFFHAMGHIPIAFSDPQEAIDAVQESKPDLLTSDLNMLNMNGLQLTSKIRSMYSSVELPVVIITTQSDFVDSATSSGASVPGGVVSQDTLINHVILKPLSLKEIKPLLDNIIQNKPS